MSLDLRLRNWSAAPTPRARGNSKNQKPIWKSGTQEHRSAATTQQHRARARSLREVAPPRSCRIGSRLTRFSQRKLGCAIMAVPVCQRTKRKAKRVRPSPERRAVSRLTVIAQARKEGNGTSNSSGIIFNAEGENLNAKGEMRRRNEAAAESVQRRRRNRAMEIRRQKGETHRLVRFFVGNLRQRPRPDGRRGEEMTLARTHVRDYS